MTELAYNIYGDPFEVPTTATAWRVRKMKPKGSPEVVYGRDGLPLALPIEAGIEELRAEVSSAGRYRLDPVTDEQRPIPEATSAYVFLHPDAASRGEVGGAARGERLEALEAMLTEITRANLEVTRASSALAHTVIEKFSGMMESAAVLVRAAGALPVPTPPVELADVAEPSEDEEPYEEAEVEAEDNERPAGLDLNALVAQVATSVVTAVCSGQVKLPSLGALLDWRRAAPPTKMEATAAPPVSSAPEAPAPAVRAGLSPSSPVPLSEPSPRPAAEAVPPAPAAPAAAAPAVRAGLSPSSTVALSDLSPEPAAEAVPPAPAASGATAPAVRAGLFRSSTVALSDLSPGPAAEAVPPAPAASGATAPAVRAGLFRSSTVALSDLSPRPAAEAVPPETNAALHLARPERIEPQPVRQLATLEPPVGAHPRPSSAPCDLGEALPAADSAPPPPSASSIPSIPPSSQPVPTAGGGAPTALAEIVSSIRSLSPDQLLDLLIDKLRTAGRSMPSAPVMPAAPAMPAASAMPAAPVMPAAPAMPAASAMPAAPTAVVLPHVATRLPHVAPQPLRFRFVTIPPEQVAQERRGDHV